MSESLRSSCFESASARASRYRSCAAGGGLKGGRCGREGEREGGEGEREGGREGGRVRTSKALLDQLLGVILPLEHLHRHASIHPEI